VLGVRRDFWRLGGTWAADGRRARNAFEILFPGDPSKTNSKGVVGGPYYVLNRGSNFTAFDL